MDLSGNWRAAPANEALRRDFHLPGFDDSGWEGVTVPGHWRDVPALSDTEEVLYRTRFEGGPAELDAPGSRAWLELDGLFYQGDVYLDGHYLGDTEGYFFQHAFDVTNEISARSEHELAIEVHCHPAGNGKRRGIMGVYDGGTDLWNGGNPGGIWAPLRLRRTGPVRIDSVKAICSQANAAQATVAVRATLVTTSPGPVRLQSELAGATHEFEHLLVEGINEIEWQLVVFEPDLWWPHRLGDQPLHPLTVKVESEAGTVSDCHEFDIGLREIRLRRWCLEINGEQIQAKGVNLAPSTELPAETTPELVATDLQLALDAGFDLVRPYAHVAPRCLYDMADRHGLMVWQDLPLVGPASNSLRGQAVRQAGAMVTALGHHPSITLWNGHVSPAPDWMQAEPSNLRRRTEKLLAHQAPTWSKSVLDRSIKNVLASHDGSRPTTAFTGVLPHLPRLAGSATHLWFGWRRGSERDLARFAARLPSQVRWVAELGAQSIPDHPDVLERIDWPRPDLDALTRHLGYERRSFDRYVPPTGHPTLGSWVEATQIYQAGLLRRQVETLRRLKYRPSGGFCVHFLADPAAAISASLLDHDRRPKPAFEAIAEACRPVIVVADRLPVRVKPGDPVALDVHVVSDEREPLVDCVVDADLTWPGGSHHWRYTGTVEADSVARIATLSWIVPDAPGLATLNLRLSGAAVAANRYDTTIRP